MAEYLFTCLSRREWVRKWDDLPEAPISQCLPYYANVTHDTCNNCALFQVLYMLNSAAVIDHTVNYDFRGAERQEGMGCAAGE